jgi:trans-aconitate 2-methyltransferase
MTSADRWDPAQYNKFATEREQPFWDLAQLLEPAESPRLVDLGCGDGRLTAELARSVGASSTIGIDSSEAMIAAATAHATAGIRFEIGDIGSWLERDSCQILFANASMQWVTDHATVLDRWTRSLRSDGQLAVQVPANADHPAHRLAPELAGEWLEDAPPDPVEQNVLAPEGYAELLDDLGYGRQHVRLQVYPHRLASTAAVVEWVKGTTLTRFKGPLGTDRWEQFVVAYRARLLSALGDRAPYFYPFKRILMWGRLS